MTINDHPEIFTGTSQLGQPVYKVLYFDDRWILPEVEARKIRKYRSIFVLKQRKDLAKDTISRWNDFINGLLGQRNPNRKTFDMFLHAFDS